MKTIKTLLFVTLITLLTISCTDTTENLVVKPTNTIEHLNDVNSNIEMEDTGEDDGENDGTRG